MEFFADSPLGLTAFSRVGEILGSLGSFEVRESKSQVSFRRKRAFAYLWIPGLYLAHPRAEVVLTIALGRHDPSPRFTDVAHPSTLHWMHHLEIARPSDIDGEVAGWLREAYERAS